MPFDSIAVVGWELVMEVVITLTKSNESGNDVISWGVAVIEWLVTEPVCQRVDAEGGLLDEENSENSSVDETSLPVSPSETTDEAREDHSHEDNGLDVVAMLPDNDRVIVQVGDVGTTNSLWVLLHDHPSDVRV